MFRRLRRPAGHMPTLIPRRTPASPPPPPASQAPAEHCGDLCPTFLSVSTEQLTDLDRECVLRPGHHGSHANANGTRWVYTGPNRVRDPLTMDIPNETDRCCGCTGSQCCTHGEAPCP